MWKKLFWLEIFERFFCIYRTNFNWCHLCWRHYIKGCVWLANKVDWLLRRTTIDNKTTVFHFKKSVIICFIFRMNVVVFFEKIYIHTFRVYNENEFFCIMYTIDTCIICLCSLVILFIFGVLQSSFNLSAFDTAKTQF